MFRGSWKVPDDRGSQLRARLETHSGQIWKREGNVKKLPTSLESVQGHCSYSADGMNDTLKLMVNETKEFYGL